MTDDQGFIEEEITDGAHEGTLLTRLYPLLAPYRVRILLSILIVVLITLVELTLPYITKVAIDDYIVPKTTSAPEHDLSTGLVQPGEGRLSPRDSSGLGLVTIIFLAFVFLDFVVNFIQKIIMEYTGHMMMHDLRVDLFRHILGLSIPFFSRQPVARLVTRVTNDIQNMHELFTTVLAFAFNDLFLLAGITIVLISIDFKLALVSFLVLPVVWLAASRFARKARGIFRGLRVKVAEINTRFSETVSGMKVIQLFRHEQANYLRFASLNHNNYLMGMDQIRLMALFLPLIEVLGTAAVALVIWYGGGRVLSNRISLGELVAFISYIRMFFRPIRDVAEKYNMLQDALSSAERIFLILDSKEKLPMPESKKIDTAIAGKIPPAPFSRLSFEKVSFFYTPGEPVLEDISFSLNAGETLGIVGPTGSGKSTLIHLIIRFHDPVHGHITYNGHELRALAPDVYLPRMAIVMQDPFLFSGTIRENILRGILCSDEKLDMILAASNCKDLVDRSPDGLDTILSEAGASLSGGERQLISIARAFARDPDLILMDEATSHIDSQTEHKIQEAMANLMKNRTAVVVAHRLATVRNLDHILVLKKGRIIEAGPHETLMAQKGFYYRLHQHRTVF